MKAELFVSETISNIIRCIDGHYDLIQHTDANMRDPLNAPGTACDQDWARNVQKRCLTHDPNIARLLYHFPAGVDLY